MGWRTRQLRGSAGRCGSGPPLPPLPAPSPACPASPARPLPAHLPVRQRHLGRVKDHAGGQARALAAEGAQPVLRHALQRGGARGGLGLGAGEGGAGKEEANSRMEWREGQWTGNQAVGANTSGPTEDSNHTQ